MKPRDARPTLEGDESKLDIGRYLRLVWRRRFFVIVPVVFITSVTLLGVRFMSPLYISEARIHLEKRTRVNRELERQIVDEAQRVRRKDELAQVRGQINSREFLESVVRELGLQNDPATLARARTEHETRTPDVPAEEIAMRTLVRGLRGKVKVKNQDQDTYRISVQDNDAENAYLLAKVISRSFVNEVKRERMDKLGELFKFSSRQLSVYRERLDQAQNELRDFQARLIRERSNGNPVTIANASQARSYSRRLDLELDVVQQKTTALGSDLRRTIDTLPEVDVVRADGEVRELERRLQASVEETLVTELERMAGGNEATAGDGSLEDGTARAALRRRIGALMERRYNRADSFDRQRLTEYAYEQLLLAVDRHKASILKARIEEFKNRLEKQPEKELQLRALEEQVAVARSNLETFERTVHSAELSETIMATQLAGGVTIVDPAEKPNGPVSPNKGRLVGLAFLMALIGGLGSIFVIEYLDKSFRNIEEIERIVGLHVIGTLPRIVDGLPVSGGAPVRRKQTYMLATSFAILVVVLGGMALYERLLRKQRIAVPRARVEAILQDSGADSDAGEDRVPVLDVNELKAMLEDAGALVAPSSPEGSPE